LSVQEARRLNSSGGSSLTRHPRDGCFAATAQEAAIAPRARCRARAAEIGLELAKVFAAEGFDLIAAAVRCQTTAERRRHR
jgi:hypothetical protein